MALDTSCLLGEKEVKMWFLCLEFHQKVSVIVLEDFIATGVDHRIRLKKSEHTVWCGAHPTRD